MFRLNIVVYPGSPKDSIKEADGDNIKIGVRERAIEGRANRALISFLSDVLKVSKCDISIKYGLKSKNKVVEVDSISKAESEERIRLWLEEHRSK